jgi:hypothetical protein
MPQAIEFWPLKSVSEVLGVHWDSLSQSGSCLRSVKAHSLTLSYTPGSLWCDSRASPWPAPLQPFCLGHKPKAKVATKGMGSPARYACCGKELLGWIREKMATQELAPRGGRFFASSSITAANGASAYSGSCTIGGAYSTTARNGS